MVICLSSFPSESLYDLFIHGVLKLNDDGVEHEFCFIYHVRQTHVFLQIMGMFCLFFFFLINSSPFSYFSFFFLLVEDINVDS